MLGALGHFGLGFFELLGELLVELLLFYEVVLQLLDLLGSLERHNISTKRFVFLNTLADFGARTRVIIIPLCFRGSMIPSNFAINIVKETSILILVGRHHYWYWRLFLYLVVLLRLWRIFECILHNICG